MKTVHTWVFALCFAVLPTTSTFAASPSIAGIKVADIFTFLLIAMALSVMVKIFTYLHTRKAEKAVSPSKLDNDNSELGKLLKNVAEFKNGKFPVGSDNVIETAEVGDTVLILAKVEKEVLKKQAQAEEDAVKAQQDEKRTVIMGVILMFVMFLFFISVL